MDATQLTSIAGTAQSSPPLTPAFDEAAPRDLCTDCGISRTSEPKRCGTACQFIKPEYASAEKRIHGRARDPARGDERFFGTYVEMHRASLKAPLPGAQWTGITTRLGEVLLQTGTVDAVLCMAPDLNDRWKPRPVIITRPEDMANCRGMRMGFAPLLALLEPARKAGHLRIGVIGIPCQVYALRALEQQLGFKRIFVIGTPCSDNTTTENFHHFLGLLSKQPETITYLEFKADYHVELRFADGRKQNIPFLQLPLSNLAPTFFPLTCRTCVDYTNSLADITVGYMGGEGEQWLIVRNQRGAQVLQMIQNELNLNTPGSAGNRFSAVKGFMKSVECAAGGLPLRKMPNWLRPIVSWLMPRIGPRGLEFARARVEMKALETVLHLRRERPRQIKNMVPAHIWQLAESYGLKARQDETVQVLTKPETENQPR
jgi:coenzyme F420 hydrogenase subunit beta